MTKKPEHFLSWHVGAALALILSVGPVDGRLLGPSSSAPTALQPWKVVAASGEVETRLAEPSDWQPVARGLNLPAASWIRTGATGRATVTQGKKAAGG